MLCNECKNNLRSWVRNELSAAHASRIEQHIADCKGCSIAAHNEQAIFDSLQDSQAVPAPSFGFEARVLGAATGKGGEAGKGSHGHGWSTPVASGAVAAALVIGIALGFGWKADPEPGAEQAISGAEQAGGDKTLAAEPVARPVARNVRLAFSSREALEGVTLTVELPPHVEVASYPGHQKLSWKVDLDKGENVVNLPLNILFSGEGELVAHLDDGRRTKTFRTSLNGASGNGDQEPSS
ncbi:zf-HC2 domain-containing protein [Marinobacter sp. SS13-12]|uniref:anti-sigma factor family protein n=1 Tax=Marinobacter sp. SS13-12 TaxID=3050451 RepID=UPI002552EF90|nr:zf-HC2 domain-containing protein [Marinobacter sp. SS13-12]MDK8465499.1 zf-HC2 domain-containing protein [Marinobacter sp. SS13-12]